MTDHVDITLWIDRRWKDAIEKHLKGETLQEHLENMLDELCNQLPEQEYKRISAEIYADGTGSCAGVSGQQSRPYAQAQAHGQSRYSESADL